MTHKHVTRIAVCIGTFGDYERWATIATSRAIPSAHNQTAKAAIVRWVHSASLAEARNQAAEHAIRCYDPEWLCFLDADDELDAGYLAAMDKAASHLNGDFLLQPATLGIHPDGRTDVEPVVIPPKPILDGNFMVIGTLVKAEQFVKVGGFADWPIYEDWDLWIRCSLAGASHQPVPDAIYRVHVNPASRNNGERAEQVRVYNQIRAQYLGSRR